MAISDENFLAIGYVNTPWESNFVFSSSSFCLFLTFRFRFSYKDFQTDADMVRLLANQNLDHTTNKIADEK